jgi:hypothetical protein
MVLSDGPALPAGGFVGMVLVAVMDVMRTRRLGTRGDGEDQGGRKRKTESGEQMAARNTHENLQSNEE